ncbi:histonelysine Nmethyltransferase SETMARlike [Trichonephila clavipes]|nr:histonelysine Nmethyltransferase SETMARlike [Trichonephila clavipes]
MDKPNLVVQQPMAVESLRCQFRFSRLWVLMCMSRCSGWVAAEIVNSVYDADAVTANCVKFWFRLFRSGIFDILNAPRTGKPNVENVNKILEIIGVDRHVNSRSITQELKIDHKTVLSQLRQVGIKKKFNVWVPNQLTPKNMMDRISISEALSKGNEIDPFLKRMVTKGEKQKRCCIPSGQRQATHVCSDSTETLGAWLGSFNASTYSLDLAPSDYHLFLALQNFLNDKKLGSTEDCENRLLEFFTNKNQGFCERGIMKLPLKRQQIIQQNSAYLTQIGQSEAC